jgi:hypothetical protein
VPVAAFQRLEHEFRDMRILVALVHLNEVRADQSFYVDRLSHDGFLGSYREHPGDASPRP